MKTLIALLFVSVIMAQAYLVSCHPEGEEGKWKIFKGAFFEKKNSRGGKFSRRQVFLLPNLLKLSLKINLH